MMAPESLLEIPLWMAPLVAAFFVALGAAGVCWLLHSERTKR